MDFKKKNIHMDRTRAAAMNQITLEEDRNIPDQKPDAAGIVYQIGNVVIEETRPGEDHATVRGALEYRVLYRTDLERILKQYGGEYSL
ncbi:MAG: DUF3794 domain-containing protein [Lachnospiraceae bacterium]|nr:DUF3794 domain-containing protein [Lachnospiraceae bacterium]